MNPYSASGVKCAARGIIQYMNLPQDRTPHTANRKPFTILSNSIINICNKYFLNKRNEEISPGLSGIIYIVFL